LIAHARDPKNRGVFPPVLRPDLLLTDDGFVMTELDSIPGGIGLTAFLNRLYGTPPNAESDPDVLGAKDAMILNFHAALAALRTDVRNPLIALIVSDEAGTYRPEMQWLAHQLQLQGRRGFCLRPEDIFPLGGGLFFECRGHPGENRCLVPFFRTLRLGQHSHGEFYF